MVSDESVIELIRSRSLSSMFHVIQASSPFGPATNPSTDICICNLSFLTFFSYKFIFANMLWLKILDRRFSVKWQGGVGMSDKPFVIFLCKAERNADP